jgi:hypothetical protein
MSLLTFRRITAKDLQDDSNWNEGCDAKDPDNGVVESFQ